MDTFTSEDIENISLCIFSILLSTVIYNETVYSLGNNLYIIYEIVINAELHRKQQCKEEVLPA